MKSFKTIWLGLLLFSVASCSQLQKPVSEKKTLQQKIETKDFTFFIDRCLPTGLVVTTFRSDEVIKIKDETAHAILPFHGLLSQNPMDMKTDDPIRFNGPMHGYILTHHPDKGWNILFKVDSEPYTYQVDMEISIKGKAVVKVTSTQRSTMTYFGELD